MKAIFDRDKLWFGALLGLIIPVLSFFLLKWIVELTRDITTGQSILSPSTVEVLSIVINVFLFRYYMVNKKYEQTGKGMLLSTFILAFVFVFKHM